MFLQTIRIDLKKTVTILVTLVFVFNTIGFLAIHPFLSFYYKNIGMRQADKPSEEELIELLVFNKDDILKGKINFRWTHSREFKYNGDMYDIVKKEENDKQLFFYCINDTKEKKLEEEFGKRVHQNSSENKQQPTANNFNNILLSEPVQTEQFSIAIVNEQIFNYWRTDRYKSFQLDIPSPPPRFV